MFVLYYLLINKTWENYSCPGAGNALAGKPFGGATGVLVPKNVLLITQIVKSTDTTAMPSNT